MSNANSLQTTRRIRPTDFTDPFVHGRPWGHSPLHWLSRTNNYRGPCPARQTCYLTSGTFHFPLQQTAEFDTATAYLAVYPEWPGHGSLQKFYLPDRVDSLFALYQGVKAIVEEHRLFGFTSLTIMNPQWDYRYSPTSENKPKSMWQRMNSHQRVNDYQLTLAAIKELIGQDSRIILQRDLDHRQRSELNGINSLGAHFFLHDRNRWKSMKMPVFTVIDLE